MAFNIEWDKEGEHLYETGTDRGVFYDYNTETKEYENGEAWNGLTSVSENPSGGELTPVYADNIKYLNMRSAEEYGATVECYTYPDGFKKCNGEATVAPGVTIGQQTRRKFGFSWRTIIGNDVLGNDYGYKIHLVWGAEATPSEKSYNTVNDSPEAGTMSYELATTPVNVNGMKPTASMEIDSATTNPVALAAIEKILYGDGATKGRLPLPDEIIALMSEPVVVTGIGVTPSAATGVVGDTIPLTVTLSPAGATGTVTFSSSNTTYATVDDDGVVTCAAEGSATITATCGSYTDTCAVTVEAAPVG